MLFEFLFPESRLFAVYDNATIHRSRGNDSLDASVMNLSPGGRQRKQRVSDDTERRAEASHRWWHPPLSTSVKLECSTLRCFKWTGHCPPSAALSVALGRWKCPPARQGASQKPGSGPVHSLTLEGPIESRYQYFTRQ